MHLHTNFLTWLPCGGWIAQLVDESFSNTEVDFFPIMIHAQHAVLIVHSDAKVLARLAGKLMVSTAEVSVATTFDAAKAVLAATPFAILITGVRLGEYNGLHLIIRSHIDHPLTAGIVISDGPDPALEQEAAKYGAACVSVPEDEARLLLLVAEKLSTTAI